MLYLFLRRDSFEPNYSCLLKPNVVSWEVSCLSLKLKPGLSQGAPWLCPYAIRDIEGTVEELKTGDCDCLTDLVQAWLPSFVSSIFFLFRLCVSCARASFSCTIFSFPGISKMYTDIIRGESMIFCGVTSIFFAILRNNLLHMFVFRGRNVFFLVCIFS